MDRPHRDHNYEIFLQGIDACKWRQPRRAPAQLDAEGPDSDAALWLAGYDMQRDERRALARHGYTDSE